MADTDTSDAPSSATTRETREDNSTRSASSDTAAATPRTILPQFALDAADARIATWSGAIVDAADTIERLVASESLPVPDGVRDLATATTRKLRSFGEQSGDYDAADMVSGLQKAAAAHPAASIGIGAAVGATLAALLIRLGSGSTTGSATGKDKTGGSSGNARSTSAKSRASEAGAGSGSGSGTARPSVAAVPKSKSSTSS